MARLVVDISEELMQQIVLRTGGKPKPMAALVRAALEQYLETFDGTTGNLGH